MSLAKLDEGFDEDDDESWEGDDSTTPRSTTSNSSFQSTSTLGDRHSRNNSLFSASNDHPGHRAMSAASLPPIERQQKVTSHSSRASVKLELETMRSELIEKAWESGVQGRKRLEAGFTLDCCRLLTRIKMMHGHSAFKSGVQLITWMIQEWPCDPPLSTIPVHPQRLGEDCASMLQNYRPGVDSTHPENSAYLLPGWLWPHASSLDAMERRGASCAHRLRKTGAIAALDGAERERILASGDVHGRNMFEGINDEIEDAIESDKVRRISRLVDGEDQLNVSFMVGGAEMQRKVSVLEEDEEAAEF